MMWQKADLMARAAALWKSRPAPCPRLQIQYVEAFVGLWRSLVARPSGGRKVAGSSPASPTNHQTPVTFGTRAFHVLRGA